MKTSSLIVCSLLLVGLGCSKKASTMTEEQAKAEGYTVVVTNGGLDARFPDHIVINGTNVPLASSNITMAPIKKD
jgi:hypothetical protein